MFLFAANDKVGRLLRFLVLLHGGRMLDRFGVPIISPLDTLKEAAEAERQRQTAIVAMVIGTPNKQTKENQVTSR